MSKRCVPQRAGRGMQLQLAPRHATRNWSDSGSHPPGSLFLRAVAFLARVPRARLRGVAHGVRLLGRTRGVGVRAANKQFTLRHTPFARERDTGNVDLVNGARRTSWTRGRRTTSRRSAAGPGHPVWCPGTHRPPCTRCHVKRAPNFSPELHGIPIR